MAQAEHQATLSCTKESLFKAITSYEEYPQFVDGVSRVQVERKGPGRARATYEISLMGQSMSYTLDHEEDEAKGLVSWTLVESNFFRKNVGRWQLQEAGPGKTDVLYAVEVEFKISVPGFILNRLVKGSLPTMVKSFEKKAKAR